MATISMKSERIVPTQERASRRLETFLDTAADIFAVRGYEAATMTEIAERAEASIGALYRYFPDKIAVAQALLVRYALEVDSHWASLIDQASALSVEEFAGRLVDLMADFAAEHPAYLPLIAAPIRFARDASVRQNIRAQFSRAFMARNPKLSRERALLTANVVVQLMKGLVSLYAATPHRDRDAVINEFKLVLTRYLADVLH